MVSACVGRLMRKLRKHARTTRARARAHLQLGSDKQQGDAAAAQDCGGEEPRVRGVAERAVLCERHQLERQRWQQRQ